MSANPSGRLEEGPWTHAVRVVNAEHFDPNTPQTSGMHRAEAVSRDTVGSKGIWAGITDVAAHAATGTHHHGEQETVIYVSPFVPHQEINPADEASKWVIVRNGHDPIVVNLEPIDDTQQEATSLTHPGGLGRDPP